MTTVRSRREPPVFRHVEVARVEPRSPRLLGVTLTGTELAGLDIGLPASSVRLLVPPPDSTDVVIPVWNGNEFRHADGTRPAIRTLTPVAFDPDRLELDVEIVLHGSGPLSTWAEGAGAASPAAVAGTGRGYDIDPDARDFLVVGDESALPAIGVLIAALPIAAQVSVIVEIADPSARIDLPSHPGLTEQWLVRAPDAPPGDAFVAAMQAADLAPDVRVWAAGEAAGVWRLRRHLFEDRDLPRSRAVVRGYWKVGRGGEADE